jgi:Tol biopolymer transport system component
MGEQEYDGVVALYTTSINGGTPRELNPPPNFEVDTLSFAISPDGTHVLQYTQEWQGLDIYRLWNVPLDGSDPIKLYEGEVGLRTGVSQAFYYNTDGSYIYFIDTSEDLYAVSATGGQPTLIADNTNTNADLYYTSPDGTTLFYDTAVRNSAGGWDHTLYAKPFAGGEPILTLSSIALSQQDIHITSDGSRIVYRQGKNLLSRILATGEEVQLDQPAILGSSISTFVISPDDAYVVFFGVQEPGSAELYSVPIDGGAPVRLSQRFSDIMGSADTFTVTPDSQQVVYTPQGASHLFTVSITGGDPVQINREQRGELFSYEVLPDYKLTPDGERVIYISYDEDDAATDSDYHLYSAIVDVTDSTESSFELNPTTGAPGSFFTLSGTGFPSNAVLEVQIAGQNVGTVRTDPVGAFIAVISTSDSADPGIYTVLVTATSRNVALNAESQQAPRSYVLDPSEPLQPREPGLLGDALIAPVSDTNEYQVYLPLTTR